jgi:hypothetical protein
LTNQLHYAFAGINPTPQYSAQIAFFRAENILPIRFVSEEC